MNKSLAIKLITVLVVAIVVYSVFWFFKLGQVEKRVNRFISENSAHVTAGEVSVSGFPFSQKITVKDLRFSIPSAVLDKRQVVVKHLEAQAGIFASDFSVTLVEPVSVQDNDNNVANVEFTSQPVITISIADGRITKFNYQDSGYKIADAEKVVIYAASSSSISVESTLGDGDKIITKVSADIKDIENFTIVDAYKNSLEKKIIDGLKTGEIAIGNASSALIPAQITDASASAPVVAVAPTAVVAAAPVVVAAPVASDSAAPQVAAPSAPTENAVLKSNFIFSAEYVSTPNQVEQQQIPLDPAHMQETPTQYSKAVKINNLKFSNSLYDISINGEMNILLDDNMPSGGLSIKIEKIDNLISQILEGLTKISERVKSAGDLQPVDANGGNSLSSGEDSYQSFLKRIVGNFSAITKETAAKNAVTKEDVAQFDVRREKNLDFLVNETPVREILGKF